MSSTQRLNIITAKATFEAQQQRAAEAASATQ
jgi:hypothetical protein